MEKKPGWKAIPYILGLYLNVGASNIIGIWSGVSNCIPLIGAAVADSYLGKFRTIAISSFRTLAGMLILTLTAWVPQFHPPRCTSDPSGQQVRLTPTTTQIAILILGLSWMAVGTGGIKPCSITFAIDQFDTTSSEGKKGVSNFFSWYYTAQTLVQLTSLTIIVYIQNKNWVLGFGTLGLLMGLWKGEEGVHQFVLLGFCEVFTIVGHIEFYNSESPEKMKSVGNSLQYLLVAFSNYAGTLVNIVQKVTRRLGKTDWMNDDINNGRLDYYYFYFLIAGL
ncbi:protein NRT1/ PTR FAMILY 2.13-like [Glycine soja]|uniref:protein NRT1/ PTR FAMILY 2.13 n=1 Tax=Glycine max TaxID=3847 RepID=UPI0003DEA3D2|nr:protein NRT1/ PTR FAMILY 2.13 [Glycine max]XP_028182436.1 protein NRT1/ PTR FAMILY 2.13-like [Glycine soja]|eukprot:XP_006575784.1 protein NRT1/ PTR FAMILY 2.13 [Glycine max]